MKKNKEKFSAGQILKFLIPSIIGVLLLVTPFKKNGSSAVAASILSNFIHDSLNKWIPIEILVLLVITVSCLLAVIERIAKPRWIERRPWLKEVSDISDFQLITRLTAWIFGCMTAFKIGPELIWDKTTGGLVLFDLIGNLFTIFLVAGFILPLLTEFGLMEYVGVFLTKFMRTVFNLPGRAAVDCTASWVGDSSIGVALTNKQYEEGYYSVREATTIATTFSVVSITFCLVVLENVGLMNYAGQYYLTIVIAGFVAALVVPRIPPLSLKEDTYLIAPPKISGESVPTGFSKHEWALHLAVDRSEQNGHLRGYLKNTAKSVWNLWFNVMPIIMTIGTLTLILSETTPIFSYLGMPFLPLLKLMQVPEAAAASHTMIIGFADMAMPSILARSIENPMTRFIIASLSVTQLIFMSETGAVILGSKIPVNVAELFVLFIERTVITLPIIVLMANLFF